MRLVIVDTNVLIAGLLIQDVNSPTSCVLDGMLRGAVMYVLSLALLGEYREVSIRPKIKRLQGLSENEIDAVLTEITANAIWRDPVAKRLTRATTTFGVSLRSRLMQCWLPVIGCYWMSHTQRAA